MSVPYPERTAEEEQERREAEDRAGESRMEQRRETMDENEALSPHQEAGK